MRYVFLGSGEIARFTLRNLLKYAPPMLVITKPDRPKGRGRKLRPTPVKEEALAHGLAVETPENPNSPDFVARVSDLKPDFIFLADYGAILKKNLLSSVSVAPLCMHPSLLPKYRGPAPLEHTFFNCERITGITVFVMEERVDAGDILLQETLTIDPAHQTKGDIIPLFAEVGARLLYESAKLLSEGRIKPRPQEGRPTYAPRLKPEDEFINPEEGFMKTTCRINGLSPNPGARYVWRTPYGKTFHLKLLRANPAPEHVDVPVGEFVYRDGKLLLGCGDGSVSVLQVRIAHKGKLLGPKEFANGYLLGGVGR